MIAMKKIKFTSYSFANKKKTTQSDEWFSLIRYEYIFYLVILLYV